MNEVAPGAFAAAARLVALAHTAAWAMIETVGAAAIGTFTDPLLVHEPTVIVTSSWTLPLAPAVNVTVGPLFVLVRTPLVMLQAYVAPPCTGTLALFPVEFSQTLGGAVMAAVGFADTVTVCESLALQPFTSVTMTLNVCSGDVGVTVIAWVSAPFDQL